MLTPEAQIQIPLPPKIDPTVTMMTVEEKPDVTYSDVGGMNACFAVFSSRNFAWMMHTKIE